MADVRRRLIATDVDGTLLHSDQLLSSRTLTALTTALEAGWAVVPVSGRHPYSILPVVAGTPLLGWCVGSNGAVGMDLRTETVLFEQTIPVPAQQEFVQLMREAVPGVKCTSIRDAGRTFVPEAGYVGLMDPGDHGRTEDHLPEFDLSDVLGTPSLKLVLRHPDIGEDVLLALARELDVPDVHASTSGAPFLEVAAGGVTKASGVALLCERLGFTADDVVAFGDNLNDVEMISWAGHGVAMGNALGEVIMRADEVTTRNDDDGLALVVERLLAG